jgi:hypothetical protein
MRYVQFILLPLIVFVLIGCSEDDSNPTTPAETKVLMPLAVGNYWIYDSYNYANGMLQRRDLDTTIITATLTDDDGFLWFMHAGWLPYRNSAYGLEMAYGGLRFKYPATLGDRIEFPTSDPYAIEVINLDTLVTTPLGDFNCIRYSFGELNSTSRTFDCYCPGVGLVRKDYFRPDDEPYSYSELIEYHLQ